MKCARLYAVKRLFFVTPFEYRKAFVCVVSVICTLFILLDLFHGFFSNQFHHNLFKTRPMPALNRGIRHRTVEIFAAPKPVTPETAPTLRRAVRSWQALSPQPSITLLGEAHGLAAESDSLGVRHDPNVDHTFNALPIFNSLLARANRSTADIAVFVNSDIILFDDFLVALDKVANTFQDFVVLAARYDLPFYPLLSNHSESPLQYAIRNAVLHAYGGVDVWAWNLRGPRLFHGSMPSFVYGRGRYDNWFTHQVIDVGSRCVVDITEAIVALHIDHNYSVIGTTKTEQHPSHSPSSNGTSTFWSRGKTSKFELFLNIYLSLRSGSYVNGYGTPAHAPWKLVSCYEKFPICLLRRIRPALCDCEYAPFVRASRPEPRLTLSGIIKPRCVPPAKESLSVFRLPVVPDPSSPQTPFGLPLTLEQALSAVASDGEFIILTAVNYLYRTALMNWVCNLRRLKITNFVVAALDQKIYAFALSHGIAAYYEINVDGETLKSNAEEGGEYGSPQFKRITKLKTQVVLRVLKMGYDVLWSDCDIIWFTDPATFVRAIHADLVVQSNAPDEENANGKGRINSGFYLARSNSRVIDGLEAVVRHGLQSNRSEQPCFNDVFCGVHGQFLVGNDQCWNPLLNIRVHFLQRELFANGLTHQAWLARPGRLKNRIPRAFLLHNNWISGLSAKLKRLQVHRFIMFDVLENMCIYDDDSILIDNAH